MNHPVKRYKPNSDSKFNSNRHRRDLYDGQVHATSAVTAGAVQNGNDSASTSSAMSPGGGIGGSGSVGDQHIKTEPLTGDELPLSGDIKKEPADGDDSKVLTESLYTSKGLQASYNDLEQLFDENSDESPGGGVSYCPARIFVYVAHHMFYFSWVKLRHVRTTRLVAMMTTVGTSVPG